MSPSNIPELSQLLLPAPSFKQDPLRQNCEVRKLFCEPSLWWWPFLSFQLTRHSPPSLLFSLKTERDLITSHWHLLTDWLIIFWLELIFINTLSEVDLWHVNLSAYNYGMKGVLLKWKEFQASVNRRGKVKVYSATSKCDPDLSSF